jgi:hypothetical protein
MGDVTTAKQYAYKRFFLNRPYSCQAMPGDFERFCDTAD